MARRRGWGRAACAGRHRSGRRVRISRCVEVHGNVDTRLRKLAEGEYDALVLAVAGLARLGRSDAVDGVLDELVPAAGQGALALEARPGSAADVSALIDEEATACVLAERELTRALGASCNTPVGACARVVAPGRARTDGVGGASGRVGLDQRSAARRGLDGLGAGGAERLLAAGAAETAP